MTTINFHQFLNFDLCPQHKTKGKDEVSESQRALAVGVISECFAPLGTISAQYFEVLLPVLVDQLNEKSDEEVRNNAVYGIGEMALHSGQISFK